MLTLLCLLGAFANQASASVILNILVDPASTAGGGATSTRSGPGSFQIYAIDTAGFGIATYTLTMGPVVTASNNRTPVAQIVDSNSDIWPAGFSLLRTAANAPQMQGAQTFPGQSPYLITGMGQSIGSFASVAAAGPNQPATVGGVPTSAAWGGPYNNGLTAGTKKWLFLGEGLWNGSTPLTSATQFISDSTFTVYSDSEFHTELTDTVLPCLLNCRAPTVVDAELYNVEADDPGVITHTFLTSGSSPIIWDGFMFNSFVPLPGGLGTGPATPAAFETASAKFSWNSVGSPPGTYSWNVTASNQFGIDQGKLTIHVVAVPEPTTISLLGLAMVSVVGVTRRSRVA